MSAGILSVNEAVIILNAVMLRVVLLCFILKNAVMPNLVMLKVILQNAVMLNVERHVECHYVIMSCLC